MNNHKQRLAMINKDEPGTLDFTSDNTPDSTRVSNDERGLAMINND